MASRSHSRSHSKVAVFPLRRANRLVLLNNLHDLFPRAPQPFKSSSAYELLFVGPLNCSSYEEELQFVANRTEVRPCWNWSSSLMERKNVRGKASLLRQPCQHIATCDSSLINCFSRTRLAKRSRLRLSAVLFAHASKPR